MLTESEFINKAYHWLGRKTRRLPLVNIEGRQVLASGLFDAEFYCQQLKGREDEAQGIRAPLKHYLHTGGFEGLDPGPNFDSDWYLAVYPDVRAVGLNPLVHYVQHGLAEGRLPSHGAKPLEPLNRLAPNADLNKKLWGGFHHLALPQLRARANDLHDHQAAWYLSAWEYAQGDFEGALQWLQVAIAHAPGDLERRHLIGLSKCYTLLGGYPAIQVLLRESAYVDKLGKAFPYIQANALYESSVNAERMSALNKLFASAGLVGVTMRDSNRDWGLGNLTAVEPVPPYESTQMPLVSIVLPAYNAGRALCIALDSLLAQTWTNLEIIVVDDGSTDETAEVAQSYTTNDSRVRLIVNSENQGAYASRNNGMRVAAGEFVTVHDGDDWSHPQKIERQMQPLLESADLVAVGSNWVRVTRDMRFVGPWLPGEEFMEPNLSSWVIRRSVLDAIGYWDKVNVAADSEFLWRLEHHYGHKAMTVVLPDLPLAFALSDEASLTRSKAGHVKSVYFGLRRLYREGCRWWHRKSGCRPVLAEPRPFPVPLGITRDRADQYDCVIAANFAVDGRVLNATLNHLEDACRKYDNVCLLHWPNYEGWLDAPIADAVFEFCQEHGLHFAHWGLTLTARKVVLVDEELWHYRPSETVCLEGLERVENTAGELCQPQEELLDYFDCGLESH
ncbi:glycosyltransferase family A protein [Marinimicrobium sp. ABcell2]|uniref:glycosyltransferase family A protein n=1 Tax=Marinimicrobium sp. ABcell2 TaxID=3069751 RepID=UPI0027B47CFC|nr:glycosyltransferase family A protein [Marinimicrobium sp. ABcell2]MDQ2078334.1 glycosyltransferase family A protein [Marinimicrobium sp. ABcell2]